MQVLATVYKSVSHSVLILAAHAILSGIPSLSALSHQSEHKASSQNILPQCKVSVRDRIASYKYTTKT